MGWPGRGELEHVQARPLSFWTIHNRGAPVKKQAIYKRKYDRLAAPFNMRILTYNYKRLDSEYCTSAEGINISPGGLSFKYPRVIREGDHLKVLVQGIRGMKDEEIMASVRIMWTETKDTLSHRVGARFLKIDPINKFKLIRTARKTGGKR